MEVPDAGRGWGWRASTERSGGRDVSIVSERGPRGNVCGGRDSRGSRGETESGTSRVPRPGASVELYRQRTGRFGGPGCDPRSVCIVDDEAQAPTTAVRRRPARLLQALPDVNPPASGTSPAAPCCWNKILRFVETLNIRVELTSSMHERKCAGRPRAATAPDP